MQKSGKPSEIEVDHGKIQAKASGAAEATQTSVQNIQEHHLQEQQQLLFSQFGGASRQVVYQRTPESNHKRTDNYENKLSEINDKNQSSKEIVSPDINHTEKRLSEQPHTERISSDVETKKQQEQQQQQQQQHQQQQQSQKSQTIQTNEDSEDNIIVLVSKTKFSDKKQQQTQAASANADLVQFLESKNDSNLPSTKKLTYQNSKSLLKRPLALNSRNSSVVSASSQKKGNDLTESWQDYYQNINTEQLKNDEYQKSYGTAMGYKQQQQLRGNWNLAPITIQNLSTLNKGGKSTTSRGKNQYQLDLSSKLATEKIRPNNNYKSSQGTSSRNLRNFKSASSHNIQPSIAAAQQSTPLIQQKQGEKDYADKTVSEQDQNDPQTIQPKNTEENSSRKDTIQLQQKQLQFEERQRQRRTQAMLEKASILAASYSPVMIGDGAIISDSLISNFLKQNKNSNSVHQHHHHSKAKASQRGGQGTFQQEVSRLVVDNDQNAAAAATVTNTAEDYEMKKLNRNNRLSRNQHSRISAMRTEVSPQQHHQPYSNIVGSSQQTKIMRNYQNRAASLSGRIQSNPQSFKLEKISFSQNQQKMFHHRNSNSTEQQQKNIHQKKSQRIFGVSDASNNTSSNNNIISARVENKNTSLVREQLDAMLTCMDDGDIQQMQDFINTYRQSKYQPLEVQPDEGPLSYAYTNQFQLIDIKLNGDQQQQTAATASGNQSFPYQALSQAASQGEIKTSQLANLQSEPTDRNRESKNVENLSSENILQKKNKKKKTQSKVGVVPLIAATSNLNNRKNSNEDAGILPKDIVGSQISQIDQKEFNILSAMKFKARAFKIETVRLQGESDRLENEYERNIEATKTLAEAQHKAQSFNQTIRNLHDFLIQLARLKPLQQLNEKFSIFTQKAVMQLDQAISKRHLFLREHIKIQEERNELLVLQNQKQNERIQELINENLEQQNTDKNVAIKKKVDTLIKQLSQDQTKLGEQMQHFSQEDRERIFNMTNSNATSQLKNLDQLFSQITQKQIPASSHKLFEKEIFFNYNTKQNNNDKEQFKQLNEDAKTVQQKDAQTSLIAKVVEFIQFDKTNKKKMAVKIDKEVQTFRRGDLTMFMDDDEDEQDQDADGFNVNKEPEVKKKLTMNALKLKIGDLNSEIMDKQDKLHRLTRDSKINMEKLVYVEAHAMIKDQKIEDLEAKLKVFSFVDVEKYKNLTSDLRKSNKLQEAAVRAYETENKLAISQLEELQKKDKRLGKLKYQMQQANFFLLKYVQDMIDRTQRAKEKLGDEIQGFDEENYTDLQAVRLSYADKFLTNLRHLAIGVPKPFDPDDSTSKLELFERSEDTDLKLDELVNFQDSFQMNVKKMAVSMGLNIAGFLSFLRDRVRLLSNSMKRQGLLIKDMITEHEKVASESNQQNNKMKGTIQSLKQELGTVVKELKAQKVQYDDVGNLNKYTKAVEEHEKQQEQQQMLKVMKDNSKNQLDFEDDLKKSDAMQAKLSKGVIDKSNKDSKKSSSYPPLRRMTKPKGKLNKSKIKRIAKIPGNDSQNDAFGAPIHLSDSNVDDDLSSLSSYIFDELDKTSNHYSSKTPRDIRSLRKKVQSPDGKILKSQHNKKLSNNGSGKLEKLSGSELQQKERRELSQKQQSERNNSTEAQYRLGTIGIDEVSEYIMPGGGVITNIQTANLSYNSQQKTREPPAGTAFISYYGDANNNNNNNTNQEMLDTVTLSNQNYKNQATSGIQSKLEQINQNTRQNSNFVVDAQTSVAAADLAKEGGLDLQINIIDQNNRVTTNSSTEEGSSSPFRKGLLSHRLQNVKQSVVDNAIHHEINDIQKTQSSINITKQVLLSKNKKTAAVRKVEGGAVKHWKPHKIAMLDKGVQVYEDEREILSKKYNWKRKEFVTKMIQTDDIRLDILAQEQENHLLSLPQQRYFNGTKKPSQINQATQQQHMINADLVSNEIMESNDYATQSSQYQLKQKFQNTLSDAFADDAYDYQQQNTIARDRSPSDFVNQKLAENNKLQRLNQEIAMPQERSSHHFQSDLTLIVNKDIKHTSTKTIKKKSPERTLALQKFKKMSPVAGTSGKKDVNTLIVRQAVVVGQDKEDAGNPHLQ